MIQTVCSAEDCDKPVHSRDLCGKHKARLRRHGSVNGSAYLPAPERYWSKVAMREATSGECWIWQAATSSFGHGLTKYNGRSTQAHRVAWLLTRGEIPPGLCVLHMCDNPPCVNPAHLFLGTRVDNARDMYAKHRNRPTVGEQHARAKLNPEKVHEIRALHADGWTRAALATRFGVSRWAIDNVITCRNWTRV